MCVIYVYAYNTDVHTGTRTVDILNYDYVDAVKENWIVVTGVASLSPIGQSVIRMKKKRNRGTLFIVANRDLEV